MVKLGLGCGLGRSEIEVEFNYYGPEFYGLRGLKIMRKE